MTTPEQIQKDYYTRTANDYDQMHVNVEDEHYEALKHISTLLKPFSIGSVLDVGAGTGRGIKYFLEKHPDVRVHGVEPVEALVEQAVAKHGVPKEMIEVGDGQALKYGDGSFDAVCEFGVLHHVKRPNELVREMMRVAKRAVFISDCNRFGQGSMAARRVKLLLWRLGLWGVYDYARTGGRGYLMSEGDGLAYSYSVYDSLDTVAGWADRVFIVPTVKAKAVTWSHPLLTASHVLLCGMKD